MSSSKDELIKRKIINTTAGGLCIHDVIDYTDQQVIMTSEVTLKSKDNNDWFYFSF